MVIPRHVKDFFYVFQPQHDQFNLIHLTITFLSLIVAQDIENNVRQQDDNTGNPTKYLEILQQSGPSALFGAVAGAVLVIPWFHKFVCIPLLTNSCIFFELGQKNYIGSAISIVYNSIHLGNGYGFKTTAIVNFAALCLAPQFRSFFDMFFPGISLQERAFLITAVQIVLYWLSSRYTIYFETLVIHCFLKRVRATTLQSSPWVFFMNAFEIKEDYMHDLLRRSLLEHPLHRRSSQTPRPLLNLGRSIEINAIARMISTIFATSTSVNEVQVVKQIVTPNARGIDVARFGSPSHQLVRYVIDLGENLSVMVHRELINRLFGTKTLNKCLSLQYLQQRGPKNDKRIFIGPVAPPTDDSLQELMRKLMDGSGLTTLKEIQTMHAMEFVENEIDLEGTFKKANEDDPPVKFELKVRN
ncbi:unnamed protein product [Caenorhabditis brenneri]